MRDPAALSRHLVRGADALRARGVAPSFDPADPRPLVLESRDGRRRRLEPGDDQALARFASQPDDFSPHAALRPIVQARGLPVIAQVAGPSEIMYLGQARGLHELFAQPAPVLVPRMEATRLTPELFDALGEAALDSRASDALPGEADLEAAAARFTQELAALDPQLRPRLERFEASTLRRARRLAERRLWRTPAALGRRAMTRPRGRWQDAVLAWAPDAWAAGDPQGYGRHLLSMCEPLEPPAHVIHTYPEDRDG